MKTTEYFCVDDQCRLISLGDFKDVEVAWDFAEAIGLSPMMIVDKAVIEEWVSGLSNLAQINQNEQSNQDSEVPQQTLSGHSIH